MKRSRVCAALLRRASLALVVMYCGLGSNAAARAQPVAVPADASQASPPHLPGRIRWSAPPGCPTVEAFETELHRYVKNTAALERMATTAVTITGSQATGWSAQIEQGLDGGRTGAKQLHTADCVLLTKAIALVVALSVDPIATTAVVEQAMDSTQPTTSPARPAQPSTPSPITTPRVQQPNLPSPSTAATRSPSRRAPEPDLARRAPTSPPSATRAPTIAPPPIAQPR